MKVLDYAYSNEGAYLLYYGIEGVHYEWSNGAVQYLEPYFSDMAAHRMDGGFVYQGLSGSGKNGPEYQNLPENVRETIEFMNDNPVTDGVNWPGSLAVQSDLGSLLGDIVKQALANAIVSDGDIAIMNSEYIDSWLKAGGNRWIEEATQAYMETNIE